jgi:DNA topoisomerase II
VVDSSGKKVKRKQATLKTRKSIGSGRRGGVGGGGDSDGNDDFMPTKKAAAAKARKPIAPASGTLRARPKVPKDLSDDEMNLDDEPPPPPPKKRAAAAAPAKKAPPKIESGSDLEMADDHDLPSPPPKKVAPAVKSDDQDSGDDLVRAALAKGKGKAAETSKRKS